MPIEVELKFKIDDLQELEYTLVENGAKLNQITNLKDYYFTHPCKDFSQTDEALRIREDGLKKYLTYKGKKLDKKTKTRFELETEIINTKDMIGIFNKLGFNIILVISKERRIYTLRNIVFCLDTVDSLGTYLEVEEIVEDTSKISDSKKRIYQLLTELKINTNQIIRDSYLDLLLKKKKKIAKS